MRRCSPLILAVALAVSPWAVHAETIGKVSTEVKWLGPNSGIEVEAFDDPDVAGVTCYVSKAVTGGFKGAVGLAEDTSDASIACRQVGPITAKVSPQQTEVFRESRSPLFKKLRVVRMFDAHRNTLVYLVYSDKLVDGSPKNSVTAVPIQPWVAR